MPALDYASGRPAYLLIADDLRARIGSGEYPGGEKLPSNKAMAKTYGVAAQTVREALDVLRREGLINTQSTRGTFVISRRSKAPQPQSRAEGGPLADRVESLELNLADLYGKLGFEYPRDGAALDEDTSSVAVAHGKRA